MTYTCTICGQMVFDGTMHSCGGTSLPQTNYTYAFGYPYPFVDNVALQRIATALEALLARRGPLAAPSTERRPAKTKIEGKRKRVRVSQTAPGKTRSRRTLAVPPRGARRG